MALSVISAAPSSAVVPTKPVISAVTKLTQHSKALPDDEIARLARIANETRGTKTVGNILGQQNLPSEVLEDTYIRIAVQQQKLSRREAEGMFERLRGTDGFRDTLSKLIGNSEVKTIGHLNELRIADTASQHGFRVKSIGLRFSDGRKAAATDIDVLLEKDGTLLAIEAKDYLSTTPIPLDSFRADMVSLTEFAAAQAPHKVIPVFSITNRPNDSKMWRLLQLETDRRNIQLIDGSPQQQIEQLKILVDII